jgi:hypothetical protein
MNSARASTALDRERPAPRATAEPEGFSAGEALADGFHTWLSRLPAFAGVALLLHSPLLLVPFLPALPRAPLVIAFLAAEFAVALLVKAALTKAVLDWQRQLPTDFAEYREALRTAPAVLALGTRILARSAVRAFLFLVPALTYLCANFVAVPAIIIEGGSIEQALRRSQQLTSGVRLRVFGICLVIWSLAALWTLSFGLLNGAGLSKTSWMIFYLCVRAFERSFTAVLSAITYHRLCDR